MKVFQNALKLHAQGPSAFDDAEKAYKDLFQSEIFKYPEAATEFDRVERQPEQLPLVPAAAPTAAPLAPELTVSAADIDGTGTSLPQTLYLAHKNRGQLSIDRLRHESRKNKSNVDEYFIREDVRDHARLALTDFSSALDRDPSDAELWRRTARVASFLNSARTSRYCLEAAIELDDDPAVLEVQPPSLVESLAGQQLKNQLELLSDEIGLSHPVVAPWLDREVPEFVKRWLDPLPFLPDPTKNLEEARVDHDKLRKDKVVVKVSSASWKDVGLALVSFATHEGMTGDAINLEVPDLPEEEEKEDEEVEDVDMVVIPTPKDDDHNMESGGDSPSAQLQAEVATPEEITPKSPISNGQPATEDPTKTNETRNKDRAVSQTRKRSQSTAGVGENGGEDENGVEKRSKRTRRRDTATVEEVIDPSALYASKIAEYQAVDKHLFQLTKDILENLGVTDQATIDAIGQVLESCDSEDRLSKLSSLAANDLRVALASFNEANAKILSGKKDQPSLSLTSFLEHAKGASKKTSPTPAFDESRGLTAFVNKVNSGWLTIHDVAFEWIKCIAQSYLKSTWSEEMKVAVVQLISHVDADIYRRVMDEISMAQDDSDSEALDSLVQMLFELHLDVYDRITNPNSIVKYSVRVETRGRLERWQDMASSAIRRSARLTTDPICLRFIWASIFFTAVLEADVPRDHILQCYRSFHDLMISNDCPQIDLPNNAVIPLISPTAAEREVSKLTTMDFFLTLFQEDMNDPVMVIENLEPVLNPSSVFVEIYGLHLPNEDVSAGREEPILIPIQECASQGLLDLWKFLESSDTELRLFLWSRLSEAYGAIKYTTKQFSCRLRSIEMIIEDLASETYLKTPDETRGALLMKTLKSLDELLIIALTLALNETTAFEIIDEDHLRSTSSALARISALLHTAAICEDEMRIASTLPSPTSTSALQLFLNKLREMQVRAWCLQYTVLRAGIKHHPDIFCNPDNDRAAFLAAVHQVLGIRKFCKASNKIFLKMMRVELLKIETIDNWEDYLGQVLFDLHGLKLGVGMWEVEDHQCPPEKLEKRTTIQLVERMTILASRMPIKELLKSDLKTTIERMQQTMGQTKSTPQMIHNLRNFTEFLKKPIHPLRLYEATKGNVTLDAVGVNTQESTLAKYGWFFLLGMIALTKFKGVDLNRRQTPGATDDLRIGATFMRLQLQFTPGKWDAWFRLAECFDYELDEAVLWTADKMNKDRGELIKLQRSAIHCYTLALSNSRHIDPEGEEADALYELHHGFGMRMYASSREPFAMEAFHHSDQVRFFIANNSGTYLRSVHDEMGEYQVWKFAAFLFRKAMAMRPKDWKNPYMYSKCLWKMYQRGDKEKDSPIVSLDRLIDALKEAARTAAAMPKSRNSDPILEPHYKMLSILHKLVLKKDTSGSEAAEILSEQPFGIEHGEDVNMDDNDNWEEYVIKSLRHLRDKDKSNWQHRMIMRHAHILFDDEEDESTNPEYLQVQAKAAFNVLRESMFTKTMVMNVWKCDAERAGRHHVYTEQYVRFMVKLLLVLEDRTNLEALLRRIRKKGADFYHFNDLWQSCCMAYLHLLRRTYKVAPTIDDAFKSVALDEFEGNTEHILEWAREEFEAPVLGCLKDAIELKKLNSNLMKATAIDDLISDCYTMIYLEARPHMEVSTTETVEGSAVQSPDAMAIDEEAKETGIKEEPERGVAEKKHGSLCSILHAPAGADIIDDASSMAIDEEVAEAGGDEKPAEAAGAATVALASTETTTKPRKTGIRRPDILRKAEQVVLRLLEPNKVEPVGPSGANKSRAVSISSPKNTEAATTNGDHGGADAGSDVEMEDGEPAAKEDADEAGAGETAEPGETGGDDVAGEDADDEGGHEGELLSSPLGSIHDSADESDLTDVPPDSDDEGGQGNDEEDQEEEEDDEEQDEEEDDEEEEEEEEKPHKPVAALLFPNLRRSSEATRASKNDEKTEEEDTAD